MMPTHGEAFIAFHASEEIILGFFFADRRDLYPNLQDFLNSQQYFYT